MELLVTLTNKNNIQKFNSLGINGVIVGQKDFSFRFNRYFNNDELKEISTEIHQLNMKLYLNINRIIHEEELDDLKKYLIKVQQYVDGIYFNDLSILNYAKKLNILNKLIYHPDTLMTNYYDINFYLDKDINSVMISPLITLEEINEIAKNTNQKLDMIIHGYLNMSYSRRKFITNYLNYIHKENTYVNNLDMSLIESTRTNKMPILEDEFGTSIFTDFIQNSFNEINNLKDILGRLIIDDIFLNDEELFDAIELYQKILNHKDYDLDLFFNKYKEHNYGTGYYYQKTNLVK